MVGSARPTTAARTALRRARCVTVLCKKRKTSKQGAPQAGAAEEPGVDSRSPDELGAFEAVPKKKTAFRRAKATLEELEAARKLELEQQKDAKRMSLEQVQHHASRKAMRVTLVDGYNVIGCWPELAALSTLAAKREQLESYLAAYALVNNRVVSLVFDSMKSLRASPSVQVSRSEKSHRMMIAFSGTKSADKVLREQADDWVRLGAVEIVVVSNDKQVQYDCMRPEVDMTAMKSDWLIVQCVEADGKVRARAKQTADRKVRGFQEQLRALGVRSWTEATLLPEAKLKAVGLSMRKTMELMMLLG